MESNGLDGLDGWLEGFEGSLLLDPMDGLVPPSQVSLKMRIPPATKPRIMEVHFDAVWTMDELEWFLDSSAWWPRWVVRTMNSGSPHWSSKSCCQISEVCQERLGLDGLRYYREDGHEADALKKNMGWNGYVSKSGIAPHPQSLLLFLLYVFFL